MEPTSIVDPETGEILVSYTPGNPGDGPVLAQALAQVKTRLAEMLSARRAIEQAFLCCCPQGLKQPGLHVEVDVNLTKDDAQRLARHGFVNCIGMSESVKYRIQKREVAKLEQLQPEKYEELMELLQGCTRSITIKQQLPGDDGQEEE